MRKINTFGKLLMVVSGLALLFLNVTSYYSREVMDMVSGNFTAPYITPAVSWVSQWTVLITLFAIIGLIIYAITNYFINRRKPDEVNSELQALENIAKEIKGLRQDMKGGKHDDKSKPTG